MLSIFYPVFSGMALALQNSLNGIMTQFAGSVGASVVSFTVQLALLIVYHLIAERKKASLLTVPLVYYVINLLAGFTVAGSALCVSLIGIAVTTCCSVVGQIFTSAIVDHFGLFGKEKNRFSLRRIPGFVLMVMGVLFINLIGDSGTAGVALVYLVLAFCLGAVSVIIRSANFRVSTILGSTICGGIVNSIGGLLSAVVMFFVLSGFKPDLSGFAAAPFPCWLAGLFGSLCLLFNIIAYQKNNVFYATIFMLIGQVAASILIDVLIFDTLSVNKCMGIAIVVAGIFLDKFLDKVITTG